MKTKKFELPVSLIAKTPVVAREYKASKKIITAKEANAIRKKTGKQWQLGRINHLIKNAATKGFSQVDTHFTISPENLEELKKAGYLIEGTYIGWE